MSTRSDADLLRRRLTAQLLAGAPATTSEQVVERLLAVQGQDFRGFRLAVRARSTGLHATDVHRALSDDRTLLVTWLNRGTLHLVRSADYPWLQALLAPTLQSFVQTRLRQEGIAHDTAERAVGLVCAALHEQGPLVRGQLRRLLGEHDIPAGQALVFILYLASIRGLIVRGPVVGSEQAFVLVADWLGAQPTVDRDRALSWLARRYLAGHGPASDADLAYWSGLPLRDCRKGLAALDLTTGAGGLLSLPDAPEPARLPRPILLGPFDPVLHGWVSRDLVAGAAEGVVTTNGVFRPSLLVRGRVAGTWTMPRGKVELSPLVELSDTAAAALHRDARRVEAFLS